MKKIFFKTSIAFTVILISAGCSTIVNSHRQKAPMMEEYMAGQNSKTAERIADKLDERSWGNVVNSGDEIMWRLEAGSINFHLGNFQESIEQFKKAEALIASYDDRAKISVRDVGGEAGAALSNMNALPYRGFCRDRIALSIFKSLAYLGINQESSFRAQLRRLRNEQKKVQDDYKAFFEAEKAELNKAKAQNSEVVQEKNPDISPEQLAANPQNSAWAEGLKNVTDIAHKGYGNFLNPAAIFLSGLGSLRDGNIDNARIDFKRLYEAMPQNPLIRQYYVSVLKKSNRDIPKILKNVKPFEFPLDRDCVYVIFANGRGAAFQQISIYFPVMTAWPVCEFYPATFQGLQVTADSKIYNSFLLANMDGIIAQEFKERLPGIITRIILSTAIKEAAYHAGLAAANQISDSTARAVALVSVAAAGTAYRVATNTADTRSWELLPKEFQLTQFPMPKNRNISIALNGNSNSVLRVELPNNAKSAIVYISAPNEKNIKSYVFPLSSDGERFYEASITESDSQAAAPIKNATAIKSGSAKKGTNEFIQKTKQRVQKQVEIRLLEQKNAINELEFIIKKGNIENSTAEKRIFRITKSAMTFAKLKKRNHFLKSLNLLKKMAPDHKNIPLLINAYGNMLVEQAHSFVKERNYANAVSEFKKIYPFLNVTDLFMFAFCHEKQGNYKEALALYLDAQKMGNNNAYLSAANIYLSKQFGLWDEEKGISCMIAAAKAGVPVAQYKLGCIFANFENSTYPSVPYNANEAKKWLEAAVANNFFPARNALRRLK